MPIGFEVSNSTTYPTGVYTYQKNLQGDVIGVVDSNGNQVASYAYDAWGAITSSSGTMADINPIRYKGYYYDSDTGMYYLQSRYYDPALRRFINADDPSLIQDLSKNSVIGTNLYAYCGNNGINDSDFNGKIGARLVSAVIGGIIGGLLEVISQFFIFFVVHHNFKGIRFNWWSLGIAVVSGVVSGLVCISRAKTMMQIISSVSIAILNNLVSLVSSRSKLNKKFYMNLFIDVTVAIITATMGGNGVASKYFKAGKNVKGYYVYGSGKGITMKLKLTKQVFKDFAKAMWNSIWKQFVGIYAKAVVAI